MIAFDIATVAAAIGDLGRAKMLTALMGGKALTATELALEADITSQTATTHLYKLVEQKLIIVEKQGRHKYFQLAGFEVAQLLETLSVFTSKEHNAKISTGPKNPELQYSRICYDHLAGKVAVELFDALLKQQYIEIVQKKILLSENGRDFFNTLGAHVDELLNKKRPICRSCLDWSERRHHLAGSLGKWILQDLQAKGWASKDLDSRIIRFTDKGFKNFVGRYNIH